VSAAPAPGGEPADEEDPSPEEALDAAEDVTEEEAPDGDASASAQEAAGGQAAGEGKAAGAAPHGDEAPAAGAPASMPSAPHAAEPSGKRLVGLSIAALGIVYGDIGTSPLYAMRECFHGPHAVAPTHEHVLGVLSLIFWSVTIVISLKYVLYVMRADNNGEGGVLALTALACLRGRGGQRPWLLLIALGLFGAALLYGDGMITPAISVLSAIEGLEVAAPGLASYVIPITIGILLVLFAVQRHGTAKVGALFGPVTLVWFAVLAVLGVVNAARAPQVLGALNPEHGIAFLFAGGGKGFLVLGAVFLVVTGGEALYADMGHFGTRPIRLTWFSVVMPALVLNYFGQGALMLTRPETAANPFYRMMPAWALYPGIVLATMATIIASQAVISGAFSLTRQAAMLGYLPRVQIRHTSETEIGQIYIPIVNRVLMVATIGLVLGFGSSSRLAAAYGMAVTTTMVITTILAFVVARRRWGWSLPTALAVSAGFLVLDLAFFGANIVKILDGGWFPLLIAGGVFLLMTTWRRGREVLGQAIQERVQPIQVFLEGVAGDPPVRVPGTAVYMTGSLHVTPPALVNNLEHNRVLHEHCILLTVVTRNVPRVPLGERLQVDDLGQGVRRVVAHYGYMEDPDVPELLAWDVDLGFTYRADKATYFLGRETLVPTTWRNMPAWRDRLFAFMSRNAQTATEFFHIPPERVMEVGAHVEL
jgi:KUP system potassium uptake protein